MGIQPGAFRLNRPTIHYLSSFLVFLSGLSSADFPCMTINTFFAQSAELKRMFFLPYTYAVVFIHYVFVLLLFVIVFLFVFSCLSFQLSLLGDDVFCSLLFFSVSSCLASLFFFLDRVPDLVWFSSVYLVTSAGFVADQLM